MTLAVSAYSTTPAIAPSVPDSTSAAAGTTSSGSKGGATSAPSIASAAASSQNQQPATQPATTPPKHGVLVFDAQGATVGGKRVALIDIINNTDGTYSETERAAAVRQINQRETAGFRWAKPASQDPTALKQYYATYLSYLKGLPKEEQASSRYKGEIAHAQQLLKDADRQIAMSNVQNFNLASYSGDSMGLFGPLVSRISQRISQQLAGLPNTNLTSTARYYQAAISAPRSAAQVLASRDPGATTTSSSSTPSKGSVSVQA